MAVLSVLIVLVFVGVPKDQREGYDDEVDKVTEKRIFLKAFSRIHQNTRE